MSMPSKMDIATYYSDPKVRVSLLSQIKGAPVLSVQQLRNGERIYRRNVSPDRPIHITQATGDSDNKQDLSWFTDRRFSEFHPVIGKKTDRLWVDIDPGKKVDLENIKSITRKVQDIVKDLPGVVDTRLSYSGGKGFYVRGILDKKYDTDETRDRLNEVLQDAFSEENAIVFSKPKGSQIRLDTSTLKDQGSIRADYSINSETGRVAIPLTERELRGFDPEQAELRRVLEKKEFAPGIPRNKRTYALPTKLPEKTWTMSVQEHNARKAGKHWDLRLVDPETGYAHSWAVPKATFPEQGGRPVLAIQTPTHTAHYALNFGEGGPRKIGKGYGMGSVEIKHKEPIKLLDVSDNRVTFKRVSDDTAFTLFRTKKDSWLMRTSKMEDKQASMRRGYLCGYRDVLVKLGMVPTDEFTTSNPPSPDIREPQEISDEHLPIGDLLRAIAQIPPDQTRKQRDAENDNQGYSVEERLNRDVTWSSGVDIPLNYMQGATSPVPGGF